MDGEGRALYGQVNMGTDKVFPIAGDLEPDEKVDVVDLATFVGRWLDSLCPEPDSCGAADLNTSDEVNLEDFAIFTSHWLLGVD